VHSTKAWGVIKSSCRQRFGGTLLGAHTLRGATLSSCAAPPSPQGAAVAVASRRLTSTSAMEGRVGRRVRVSVRAKQGSQEGAGVWRQVPPGACPPAAPGCPGSSGKSERSKLPRSSAAMDLSSSAASAKLRGRRAEPELRFVGVPLTLCIWENARCSRPECAGLEEGGIPPASPLDSLGRCCGLGA